MRAGDGPREAGKLIGRPREFTDVQTHEDRLLEPLSWRKPARVFVNSMSDLFHEDVPDAFIGNVFSVMEQAPRHTFQILTKRAERMRAWVTEHAEWIDYAAGAGEFLRRYGHVWLGVSVENQHFADERIPLLLQTSAAVRFISAEPLLGPIDLSGPLNGFPEQVSAREYVTLDMAVDGGDRSLAGSLYSDDEWQQTMPPLDWVIVGGESGPGARPFDLAWARSIVAQCKAAGVSVFYKQGGSSNRCRHDSKGGCFECVPDDLRVREFPHAHV